MRVFLAGATGAIGKRLVPQLIAAGHSVTAMTRSVDKAAGLREAGATPNVCDVFDAPALRKAMGIARPDVVIHQLTDLPQQFELRKLAARYEANNRIRREGTQNLVDAARSAGVRRIVVQSMASWYAPDATSLRTETDALYLDAPEPVGGGVRALAFMENCVWTCGIEAVILRYGAFYGRGAWHGREGAAWRLILQRRYPIVGDGAGVYSWIHLEDAASATVLAMNAIVPGTYNVVDDEPAPVRQWLPVFAAAIGAKPPFRVPRWLALLAGSRGIVDWESSMPGASNARIKRLSTWRPAFETWRRGFFEGLD